LPEGAVDGVGALTVFPTKQDNARRLERATDAVSFFITGPNSDAVQYDGRFAISVALAR
jgi:hypothetical protein